jgi:hypothetical protein
MGPAVLAMVVDEQRRPAPMVKRETLEMRASLTMKILEKEEYHIGVDGLYNVGDGYLVSEDSTGHDLHDPYELNKSTCRTAIRRKTGTKTTKAKYVDRCSVCKVMCVGMGKLVHLIVKNVW